MSRSRIALFCAAGAVLVAGAVIPLACRVPQPPPPWTPGRVEEALAPLGYDCHTALHPSGRWVGLYLRRPGDNTPWEDFGGLSHRAFTSTPGRLRVFPNSTPWQADDGPEEGRLVLGRLVLEGHPDELRAAARALVSTPAPR